MLRIVVGRTAMLVTARTMLVSTRTIRSVLRVRLIGSGSNVRW